MAKSIAESVSVAANAVSADQMIGTTLQFTKFFSRFLAAFNAASTGIRLTWIVGSEAVYDDVLISDANRFPINPDDYRYNTGAEPGDQIQVRFRNTTGVAIVVEYDIVRERAVV